MMDITMCKADNCPVKEKCKRFNSEKNGYMQSYFVDTPGKWKEDSDSDIKKSRVWTCDMFWGQQQDNIMDTLKNILN